MNWPQDILEGLKAEDNYRRLVEVKNFGAELLIGGRRYMNFSSNDYLGLSSDTQLQREFFSQLDPQAGFLMSNPASRLITGNSTHYSRLENTISFLFGGRAALVVGSGYLANSGILPTIADKGDLILADKLVHASIIDGLKLCRAEWKRFNHNDMTHLESLLEKASGYNNIWVVTESLFSMDGDFAPLKDIDALRRRFGFRLYLDEAHAFGVRGGGLGYAAEVNVQPDIMMATLGKAIASCGAFAVCDEAVRELLVNRMRTLIFSTALPPVNLMWSDFVLRRLAGFEPRRKHLQKLITILTDNPEASQIVPLMACDNARALAMAEKFREAGFWTRAIRYPTVPRGKARVRVSLSAALGEEDVKKFRELCSSIG